MGLVILDTADDVAPVAKKHSKTITVRGQPKSGRIWKNTDRRRHSANITVAAYKTSWEEKSAKKKEFQLQKLSEKKFVEDKLAEKKAKQLQMAEARKKKADNERRGEIVQPITDTRKLKKMSRKQWRSIRKGDATVVGKVVKG